MGYVDSSSPLAHAPPGYSGAPIYGLWPSVAVSDSFFITWFVTVCTTLSVSRRWRQGMWRVRVLGSLSREPGATTIATVAGESPRGTIATLIFEGDGLRRPPRERVGVRAAHFLAKDLSFCQISPKTMVELFSITTS